MLSDRLRPNIEAAPWVIDEIRKLEQELANAYSKIRKIRSTASDTAASPLNTIFDRL